MALENSKLVFGGDLMLFTNASVSGGTVQPCGFSTSAKLGIKLDTREISSKDNGVAKEYMSGRYGWDCATDALLAFTLSGATNSVDALYTSMLIGKPISITFGVKSGVAPFYTVATGGTKSFTGSAYITAIDMTAGDNAQATYSCTMQGTGELKMI